MEVRLYGRKLSRLSISRLQIELFPLDCEPDGGIPQRSHLANFSQFRGIVVRAKGFIATAEHMNSIGDFEVVMPKPVFLLDGIVHQSPMRLGLGSSLSKNLIGEQRSEPGIPCIGKLRAIDRQWLITRVVPSFRGREGIHKVHVGFGHYLPHGFRV